MSEEHSPLGQYSCAIFLSRPRRGGDLTSSSGATRIEDERHGLERVLDNALREAEACAGYALDAEAAGDARLAGFFREVCATHERIAGRTEGILGGGDDRLPLVGITSGGTPAEGDPGDVSPGQDDT
jgi:hypothetical protein